MQPAHIGNSAITPNDIVGLLKVSSVSPAPEILTDIYRDDCNIAVWQRRLPADFVQAVSEDIARKPIISTTVQVSADSVEKDIESIADDRCYGGLLRGYIAETIDMFCVLFDAPKVGLRLSTLNEAMCPRFHVDRVPCRLVTTFSGAGTDWLPHDDVNRTKLGHGSEGKSDETSGLFSDPLAIQSLQCGDVALFKGETWEGNEGAGLVHRSPMIKAGDVRLLLTLDFVN